MDISKDLITRLLTSRTQALTLFMWLLVNADEEGNIDTSVRKLSNDTGLTLQQTRSALHWCVSNTLCNTASNTQVTHVTINNIGNYDVLEKTSNTPGNTVTNTLKDKETEKDKRLSLSPLESSNSIEKDKDKEKESSSIKSARKIFVPPTVEEVKAYIAEKGWQIDAEQWWNFYNSKGWMVGKNKMQKWKSAVATWKSRHPNTNNNGTGQRISYSEQRKERDDWFEHQARDAFLSTIGRSTEDDLPFR